MLPPLKWPRLGSMDGSPTNAFAIEQGPTASVARQQSGKHAPPGVPAGCSGAREGRTHTIATEKPVRIRNIRINQWRHFENIELQVDDDVGLVCIVGAGGGGGKERLNTGLELTSRCTSRCGLIAQANTGSSLWFRLAVLGRFYQPPRRAGFPLKYLSESRLPLGLSPKLRLLCSSVSPRSKARFLR